MKNKEIAPGTDNAQEATNNTAKNNTAILVYINIRPLTISHQSMRIYLNPPECFKMALLKKMETTWKTM